MLKRLTLQPEASGENVDGTDVSSEQSELRLRRSLEMLSSGPRRDGGDQPPPPRRDNGDHAVKSSAYSPASARRHRFKDDGEVPVVHVASHRGPSTAAALGGGRPGQFNDSQATEERAARERAERALESARETIRHLQTRVGHAELALREALEQAEARDAIHATLRQELDDHRAQIASARGVIAQVEAARAEAEAAAMEEFDRQRDVLEAVQAELLALRRARTVQAPQPQVAPKPVQRRPRVPAPALVEEEQEPVQWWLASEKKAAVGGRRAKG